MSTTWCCRAWSFGHVLRSPHAHARIRAIDATAAKAAPGVLAVLTGADWEASGWGDLPSPSGLRLRDGAPAFRPRFPALVKDRVRWVGDYVAFVVALTKDQAADAAELIAVDYEPLPAIVSTAGAVEPGAPLVWDEAPGNVAFFHPEGDAAATDAAFADAAHVVRRRFVDQPGDRRQHGAARCDRRLQPGRGPLDDLHRPCSAPTATAPSWRARC